MIAPIETAGAGVRSALLLGAVVALAACGGSSHATPPGAAPANGSATTTFVVTIPNAMAASATSRKPAFVSPSTLSGTVQVNGGTVQELDLSAGSSNCTTISGGRTCNITTTAPIGTDTVTMVLYSGAYSGGMHSGTALSGAYNFSISVAEGAANVSVPIVLGGIAATADVRAAGTIMAETPSTTQLIITAYDAAGNIIVGPGPYVDSLGNSGLIVSASASNGEVLLIDGTQSSSQITLSAPSDVVTMSVSGAADVLGVNFNVRYAATGRLAAKTTQFVPFTGTLRSTLVASSISADPDYEYFSASNANFITGVPSGFAISYGTESSGGGLGYFDSSSESFETCSFNTNFNLAVTPVSNGIGVVFNGDFSADTAPTGVAYYPLTTITSGGSCGSGNRYVSSHLGRSLVFDQTNNRLFEGDDDNTLRYDAFSSPNFSSATAITSYSFIPDQLLSYAGAQYFVEAGGAAADVYEFSGISSPATYAGSGNSYTSATLAQDDIVYVLDRPTGNVYRAAFGATPAAFAPSGFSATPSTQSNNLVIGPDGTAYSSDGSSTILTLTSSGVRGSLSLPAPGGNVGYVRALFNGINGYVYAFYDDGLHAGELYVYRLSY